MTMQRVTVRAGWWAAGLLVAAAWPVLAQGPHGRGGMKGDAAHMRDAQVIHELLDHGARVTRTVTNRPDGVETLTESADPELAAKIKTHVAAMYTRLQQRQPIHMRDPLFREIFANAEKITLSHELTANGVRVTETSTDPYVVKLIQQHAEVLNQFIRHGRAEAMKDHEVPAR